MPEIVTRDLDPAKAWYRPGPSITEFHESLAFIRCLIGGRGSGKTTAIAVEAVGHALHNPGAKVLLLRKTELSQDSTTIDTFNMVYGSMGELYKQTPTSLFHVWDGGRTVRLPSLRAIELYEEFKATNPTKGEIENWLATEGEKWCSRLEFRGIPDSAKRDNKLRGYECSLAIFVEADLLEEGDFQMLLPSLRWKNAEGNYIEDTGVILDTNPPGTRHWIARMEKREAQDQGSPARFWHLSTYENEANLPPNYIERNVIMPYRDNPPMIQRMLYGQYADAYDGQRVYDKFNPALHAGEDLPFPRGAYLVRGWDFGTSQAVIWSAYWKRTFMLGDATVQEEFWWDLHELVRDASDVEKQCRDVVRVTDKQFPFWNDREQCAGVLDYCDPAGAAKKDTGSSIAVLKTYGIYPGYKFRDRGIPKTIALCNRLLAHRTRNREVVYRIDRKHCPQTYAALSGGYRYPKEGEAGFGGNLPLKDGIYDHPADAWRYAKINCLRLADMDVEKKAPPVGDLKRPAFANPARRWT